MADGTVSTLPTQLTKKLEARYVTKAQIEQFNKEPTNIPVHPETVRGLNGFLEELLATIIDAVLQRNLAFNSQNARRTINQLMPIGSLARQAITVADKANLESHNWPDCPVAIHPLAIYERARIICSYYSQAKSLDAVQVITPSTSLWMAAFMEFIARYVIQLAATGAVRNKKDTIRPQDLLFILEKDEQLKSISVCMSIREFLRQVIENQWEKERKADSTFVEPIRRLKSEETFTVSNRARSITIPQEQEAVVSDGDGSSMRRRASSEVQGKESFVTRIKSGIIPRESFDFLRSPTNPTSPGFLPLPVSPSMTEKMKEFEELIIGNDTKKVSLTPVRLKEIEEKKVAKEEGRGFMKLFSTARKKSSASSKDKTLGEGSSNQTEGSPFGTPNTPRSRSPESSPSTPVTSSPSSQNPRRVRSKLKLANIPQVLEEEEEGEPKEPQPPIPQQQPPSKIITNLTLKEPMPVRRSPEPKLIKMTEGGGQRNERIKSPIMRSKSQELPKSILKNAGAVALEPRSTPPIPSIPIITARYTSLDAETNMQRSFTSPLFAPDMTALGIGAPSVKPRSPLRSSLDLMEAATFHSKKLSQDDAVDRDSIDSQSPKASSKYRQANIIEKIPPRKESLQSKSGRIFVKKATLLRKYASTSALPRLQPKLIQFQPQPTTVDMKIWGQKPLDFKDSSLETTVESIESIIEGNFSDDSFNKGSINGRILDDSRLAAKKAKREALRAETEVRALRVEIAELRKELESERQQRLEYEELVVSLERMQAELSAQSDMLSKQIPTL